MTVTATAKRRRKMAKLRNGRKRTKLELKSMMLAKARKVSGKGAR